VTGLRARLERQPDGYPIPVGRVLAIYSGLMLIVFLSSSDQTIVATALPSIVADIGGLALYPWVFTGYLLTLTIAVPVVGKLSDVYGKRPLLLAAIGLFVGSSALCGLAPSMPVLIALRALQGIGAGGLMPLAIATIGVIVPLRDRGRYGGLIVAAWAAGAGAGPLLGGLIVDHADWRWIFYVNLPFGLLALAVIWTAMSPRPRSAGRPIDWFGAATLGGAAAAFMLALVWGGRDYAWRSPQVGGAAAAGVVTLLLFVVAERRAVEPILPFALLRQRTIAASVTCYALGGMVTLGSITYVPLFVQGSLGRSATASGFALWPQMLAGAVASFLAGQWIARRGQLRPTAIAGPVFMTAGMVLLWRADVHTTTGEIARAVALGGFGWGLMAQVFILSVQNAVDRTMIGSATALMFFSRSMGAAVGVAAMGAIINRGLPAGMTLDPARLAGARVDPATRSLLANALQPAFLAAACISALIFPIVVFALEQVNLRRSVDRDALVAAADASAGSSPPASA
jgi:EmrB/QacA subfamily drug resistance transporter